MLNDAAGWRAAYLATAAASAITALTAWPGLAVLRRPAAEEAETDGTTTVPPASPSSSSSEAAAAAAAAASETLGLGETLGVIFGSRVVVLLYLASALRFMAGFTILAWLAPYARETFADSELEPFALVNAAIKSGGGLAATALGGTLVAFLRADDDDAVGDCENAGGEGERRSSGGSGRFGFGARADAVVPALGSLLAAPAWAAVLLAGSFELAMGALLLEYLLAENWIGPTVAVLQSSLPSAALGTAQGIFSGLTAVGNLAPAVVGLLVSSAPQTVTGVGGGGGGDFGWGSSDALWHLAHPTGASVPLRDAMLAVVCGAYVAAFFAFTAMGLAMDDSSGDPSSSAQKGDGGGVAEG